jgi:hypothetical protein
MTGYKLSPRVSVAVCRRGFKAVIGSSGSLHHLDEEFLLSLLDVILMLHSGLAAISGNEGEGAFVSMDVP